MNYERGFSPLIIIIAVVAVAVLSGGTYVVVRQTIYKTPVIKKPITIEQPPRVLEIKEEKSAVSHKTTTDTENHTLQKTNTAPKPTTNSNTATKSRDPFKDPVPPVPINLALPILVEDIRASDELISPYGIIRHSRDAGIGHGGIDFPLANNSPVYAIADGKIIKNNLEDPGGGKTVDILISSEFSGEGWIFKYEHINLESGLAVGNTVRRGQKIGTNGFAGRGNNHIGLEYHIKNFTIAREKTCFLDYLELAAKQKLENAFDKIKNTAEFIQSWQTAQEEGYYQYKDLLDKTKYPNGPQLCYPLGTDARVPVN